MQVTSITEVTTSSDGTKESRQIDTFLGKPLNEAVAGLEESGCYLIEQKSTSAHLRALVGHYPGCIEYFVVAEQSLSEISYGGRTVRVDENGRAHEVKCKGCASWVQLSDGFANSCDCGYEYNGSGELLAPRSRWGLETGEYYA